MPFQTIVCVRVGLSFAISLYDIHCTYNFAILIRLSASWSAYSFKMSGFKLCNNIGNILATINAPNKQCLKILKWKRKYPMEKEIWDFYQFLNWNWLLNTSIRSSFLDWTQLIHQWNQFQFIFVPPLFYLLFCSFQVLRGFHCFILVAFAQFPIANRFYIWLKWLKLCLFFSSVSKEL